MEEKKSIKISLSTFFLIICVILICLMGYYILNITKLNEEYSKKIAQLENENSQIKEEIENGKESEVQKELQEESINKFEQYKNNYEEAFNKVINGNNKISTYLEEDELPGILEVYVDANNDAYVTINKDNALYSKYGSEYKVATNVANIYVCHVGNGGLSDIIFLKQDGTVSTINGTEVVNGNIECKKVNNVKDIISVISYAELDEMGLGGSSYAFVDINGKIIK